MDQLGELKGIGGLGALGGVGKGAKIKTKKGGAE
jgi:hypothetical protein